MREDEIRSIFNGIEKKWFKVGGWKLWLSKDEKEELIRLGVDIEKLMKWKKEFIKGENKLSWFELKFILIED